MSSRDDQPSGTPLALHGAALVIGVMVLSSANFMAVLDINIVNVAIPYIAGGLAVSPDEATWVITSYAVAEAIVVPLTGWLASRFGTVQVFIVGVIGFGIASVLCGISTSFPMLLTFRVIQGMMGAPLIPASQTLVMRISPPDKQNMTLGLWSMSTIAGPVAGPWLGGLLADGAGWRWAFYLNAPLVVFCAVLAWRTMRSKETPIARTPIDFVGLALLVVWVGALQILLDNGQKYDWFQSSFILASGLIAGISFLAFVAWELTDKNPIVNLRIFHDRTFAVAVLVLFLALGGFAAMLIIIPLWLQTNLGYTATSAGEIIALTAVLGMVSAPIVGKLMGKVDPRALICVGVLIMSAACFYRTGFNQDMTFRQLIPGQLAFGLSLPFWFLPIMSLTVSTVKPEETAAAAGLSNFMRTLATAVSVAIATTYWLDDATRSQATLVGELHRPQALIGTFEQAGRTHPQALQALDNLVQSQAVMLSTNHWCFTVGVVLAITACLVWLMPKTNVALQATAPNH
jgi:MFS transporter, DHA2 family, multidrug resistance protein